MYIEKALCVQKYSYIMYLVWIPEESNVSKYNFAKGMANFKQETETSESGDCLLRTKIEFVNIIKAYNYYYVSKMAWCCYFLKRHKMYLDIDIHVHVCSKYFTQVSKGLKSTSPTG